MFGELIKECRQVLGENALDPDLHRNSVKALEKERRAQIPDLRRRLKNRNG